jgi:hypothetical protein
MRCGTDPATSRVHQTRDVIWLDRMYCIVQQSLEPTNNIVVELDMEPVIVYHTQNPGSQWSPPREGDNHHEEEVIDENGNKITMMIMGSIVSYRMNSLMQRQNK